MSKYDFLIVGAGFFGASFARCATDLGKRCLVIDKLPHIAGAAYDRRWDNGVMVSEYGAHIVHSQSDAVWHFLECFAEIVPFVNKPKVLSGGKVYSFPINLMTMHQLWGVVTPEDARRKIAEVRVRCDSPRNFEEWALDKIGRELYELFIYGYTKKQWLKEPSELPKSIIQRLPIRFTYEENYFATKYQGMPKDGYSQLVHNMLDGIDVRLEVDFFTMRDNWQNIARHLVYTGPVDRYFDYTLGELEYNTLRFEHKVYRGDFQGNAVFNHVDASVPHIRTIEHRHFYHRGPKHESLHSPVYQSVVSYDIPIAYAEHPEPYYPIRDDRNSDLYAAYMRLNTQSNVTFGGRLGEYKYLDIDQSVASALSKADKLITGREAASY